MTTRFFRCLACLMALWAAVPPAPAVAARPIVDTGLNERLADQALAPRLLTFTDVEARIRAVTGVIQRYKASLASPDTAKGKIIESRGALALTLASLGLQDYIGPGPITMSSPELCHRIQYGYKAYLNSMYKLLNDLVERRTLPQRQATVMERFRKVEQRATALLRDVAQRLWLQRQLATSPPDGVLYRQRTLQTLDSLVTTLDYFAAAVFFVRIIPHLRLPVMESARTASKARQLNPETHGFRRDEQGHVRRTQGGYRKNAEAVIRITHEDASHAMRSQLDTLESLEEEAEKLASDRSLIQAILTSPGSIDEPATRQALSSLWTRRYASSRIKASAKNVVKRHLANAIRGLQQAPGSEAGAGREPILDELRRAAEALSIRIGEIDRQYGLIQPKLGALFLVWLRSLATESRQTHGANDLPFPFLPAQRFLTHGA